MLAKEKLGLIYQALDDKKAQDIQMIDIQTISPIADYFIIASAGNSNQLMAFVDAIDEVLAKAKVHTPKTEGSRGSGWILVDYGDVVVHLFLESDRDFYDIERIWSDGTPVSYNDL